MTAFPALAARFFRDLSEQRVHPICLRTDRDFQLQRSWGDLAYYGFQSIGEGEDCRDQMPFLWGFDGDTEEELPFVGTPNDRAIHVYLKPLEEGLMVLLVDATEERDRQQDTQQIANEVRLLNYRQQQLVEDLRRAHDELAIKREQAEEANRLKSRFIAGMSHEFRTPITSILGNAQRVEGLLAADAQELVKAIFRGARHLLSLVDNLLDQGRLDAGEWVLAPSPVQPGELLEDLRAVFADPAARKGLALDVSGTHLPERVTLDGTRLRQILVNLLGNALKFTRQGSVSLQMSWRDERLSVQVRDSGPGIPRSSRHRLFMPFSRVGDRTQPGAGLGLAISRGLAERMGGSLELADNEPPGCEFVLRLPAPVPVAEEKSPDMRHATILLAEDDPDIAALIELQLDSAGYRVILAENGVEALERIGSQVPDLVITDLSLPKMNGLELIERLRVQLPGLPVIMMTASAREEDLRRAKQAGAARFLIKPVEPELLLAALDEELEPKDVR